MVRPEVRGVVTPEAVVLEFENASIPSRAFGQLIDLFVRIGLFYGLALFASVIGLGAGSSVVVVTFIIGTFLIIFGYPVLFEARWQGRTIGKRMLGLRVVTVEGAPVSFRHAAIRAMVAIVDFFIPPIGVVATFSVLLTPRSQRLGDVFAGTIVLRERTGAAFPVPVSFPPLPGYDTYARSLDVGGVTPEQYGVIRSFLLRVAQLSPEAARQHRDEARQRGRHLDAPHAAAGRRARGVPRLGRGRVPVAPRRSARSAATVGAGVGHGALVGSATVVGCPGSLQSLAWQR